MTRYLWIGVVASIMTALSAVNADPPKYEPQPAKLFQTRDGLGNIFHKLNAGKEVRIAYFGGSITAAGGWRVKTLKWFQETYPDAKVSEINAAIGGTGSDLGVFRFQQDVLDKKPDLIFVEFAVNDGGAAPESIWRCMEGIVRQAWKADPTIDICYVYTMVTGFAADLDKGNCPRAAGSDEMLAAYYGIPSINVAMRIAELARDGKLIFVPKKDEAGKDVPTPDGVTVFSNDNVHPLDAGHQIYTDVIADALKEIEPAAKPAPHELKAPFVADNLEQAKLVALEDWMLTPGWKKLDPTKGMGGNFHHFMPVMWEATQPGEKISFKFKGTAVKLYDILGPDGGNAICTLDGKIGKPQPRFDSYCSYHRLASLWIAEGLPDAVHSVTVEISPDQPDRSSVTSREKDKPGYDPKKYDGTAMRVGSIMLVGDIVKE
jgi:hypothetical protein